MESIDILRPSCLTRTLVGMADVKQNLIWCSIILFSAIDPIVQVLLREKKKKRMTEKLKI